MYLHSLHPSIRKQKSIPIKITITTAPLTSQAFFGKVYKVLLVRIWLNICISSYPNRENALENSKL